MTGLGWIVAIIVGGIAGWIAEKMMDADHGLLMNVLLGVGGAVVLNALLAGLLGAAFPGVIPQFFIAVLGASGLIYGYRMIRRAR